MSLALPAVIRQFWHDRSASARRRAINLSLLGECLAVGDAYATDLPDRLAADSVDWQGLSWLAGACLVTPSLAGALQRKGLFDRLPDEVQDYLHTLQSLNRERNQMLREQLIIITEALNRIDIQPVLLKGAITLTSGQYPGAEDRVIGDLDLLVSDSLMEVATAALTDMGYQLKDNDSQWVLPNHQEQHNLHGFPLIHPDLPVRVELHRRILADKGDDALLCQQLITVPFTFDEGPTVLIPDVATRLLHNMLHCQISDRQRVKKMLNLRQLLEFAALVQHETILLDTNRLLNRLHLQHQAILAEYWAQAEHWLQMPYPDTLPRSPHQARQLWLLEKVATRLGWHQLFIFFDWLSRLPRRLLNLLVRLRLMPGYFPVRIRAVLKGQSY